MKRKKKIYQIDETVNYMSAEDVYSNAFDNKEISIKVLWLFGIVAAAAFIIFMKNIYVAATILAGFVFGYPFYLKYRHVVIEEYDRYTKKFLGSANKGHAMWGVAMFFFSVASFIFSLICDKLFPAYSALPTILMLELALGLLAKLVAEYIYHIIIANKLRNYYYDDKEEDLSTIRTIYGNGWHQLRAMKPRILIITVLLMILSLLVALGVYNLRSSSLEAMFDANESYNADVGDEVEIRYPIPESVLEDMSHGYFEFYSSRYVANYNYTTETNGFEMKFDISVLYEYGKHTTPNWTVKKYQYNSGELIDTNHSGVWTGEGTDDHSSKIFKDECTFTLTFETLTNTYAKGNFHIVGTDGTEIYQTDFEGPVEKIDRKLVATVLLSTPRHTFSGLDDDLEITIDPTEDKVTLGMDYLSATLKISNAQ